MQAKDFVIFVKDERNFDAKVLCAFLAPIASMAKVLQWYSILCVMYVIVNHTTISKDNRACLLGVSHRLISSQANVK